MLGKYSYFKTCAEAAGISEICFVNYDWCLAVFAAKYIIILVSQDALGFLHRTQEGPGSLFHSLKKERKANLVPQHSSLKMDPGTPPLPNSDPGARGTCWPYVRSTPGFKSEPGPQDLSSVNVSMATQDRWIERPKTTEQTTSTTRIRGIRKRSHHQHNWSGSWLFYSSSPSPAFLYSFLFLILILQFFLGLNLFVSF